MPYREVNVHKLVEKKRAEDAEFKELWDNSRTEYRILGELVKLRKAKGLSQADLASITGNKQQAISRIEKKENSPTLKTLCSLLDALDYDIQLVPRQRV